MISARNREISYRKALRKRRIAREIYSYGDYICEYYDNLHQYSKNKIHCSCAACQQKTRNKGRKICVMTLIFRNIYQMIAR